MDGLIAAKMNTSALTVALVVVMSKLTDFMSVGVVFFICNVLGLLICIFFNVVVNIFWMCLILIFILCCVVFLLAVYNSYSFAKYAKDERKSKNDSSICYICGNI